MKRQIVKLSVQEANTLSETLKEALALITDKKQAAVVEAANRQATTPKGFVDLGLPSGILWAEKQEDGYYTYDEAQAKYGDAMPQPEEFVELWRVCKWKWNKEKKGYDVTGPNGNSIFLAASGYRNSASGALNYVGSFGHYWSAAPNSADYAYCLYFNSGSVNPLYDSGRASGFSVLPVRRIY